MSAITHTLTAQDASRTARLRLGDHYLRSLRSAALVFQRGQESVGAALGSFDRDLAQISQWLDWSASLAANNPDVARLFLKLALAGLDILAIRQHPQERIRWLESALSISRQLGDEKSARVFLFYLFLAHAQLGALDAAEGCARQLYESARAARDRLFEGRALYALGSLTEDRGDYDAAERLLQHSLDILTRLGDERHASQALNVLGAIALYRGQTAQAVDCFTRCLEIAERQGRPNDIATALLALAQA
ncbi:MAG: tetratricopeptide repeat protein, partial [Anaerolineae bacterium]|nr:tetratricopeptide repeat protein [Anaerolineae bacterium]